MGGGGAEIKGWKERSELLRWPCGGKGGTVFGMKGRGQCREAIHLSIHPSLEPIGLKFKDSALGTQNQLDLSLKQLGTYLGRSPTSLKRLD